jgi:hypothetical protein
MRGVASFLFGFTVGALAIAAYRRMEDLAEREDERAIEDQIASYLQELEQRLSEPSPKKKAVRKKSP